MVWQRERRDSLAQSHCLHLGDQPLQGSAATVCRCAYNFLPLRKPAAAAGTPKYSAINRSLCFAPLNSATCTPKLGYHTLFVFRLPPYKIVHSIERCSSFPRPRCTCMRAL